MYLSRLLVAMWVLATLGTFAELLLLGHYEDAWQLAPLVTIGLLSIAGAWYLAKRSRAALTTFRALLVVAALSGIAGLYLHYSGNVEWERESDPAIAGADLFVAAMTGATPALAPGAMVLIALIGWALTISPFALPRRDSTLRSGRPS